MRRKRPPAWTETEAWAAAAGLTHAHERQPGIRREGEPGAFVYRAPNGRRLQAKAALARIARLAIPPAWREVWIAADEAAHIQAIGRDARGRKQYRYHPRWRAVRDQAKFDRMAVFGAKLPALRARMEANLALPGLSRDKVLAAVVRLLETTLIRVGNDEYARDNGSYGLTTLRNRHVKVAGAEIRFRFTGKHGKAHEVALKDKRLARIVAGCSELPGQELFAYRDEDGLVHDVTSGDVNAYLKEATGEPFTAKDFRTFFGTVLAARALADIVAAEGAKGTKRQLDAAVRRVADKLGNTPAICRRCYIHPAVMEAHLDGAAILENVATQEAAESTVLAFLARRARAERSLKEKLEGSLAVTGGGG